jgi:hypothetical protein
MDLARDIATLTRGTPVQWRGAEMNWTAIGISLGLVILVLRQIRGRQLSVASLLWPVSLVLWAAFD